VFLGVDERSAPSNAQSLPLSKPTESSTLTSHSPYGIPYFGLDVTNLDELRGKFAGQGLEVSFT
jgi:NAD+ diphosphatase